MRDKIKAEIKDTVKEFLFVCLCGLVPLAYEIIVIILVLIKKGII